MKSVLIVENSNASLIKESNTSNDYILSGTFTEFGIVNRNDRVYTAEKFLPALNELNERINSLGVVYGEFDHPDVFDTSLSRASHIVTKTRYVQEKNLVEGEIKLLSTHWGKEARALVDDGCPLFVSSRAAGVTEANGEVTLKKLFTYDAVADPGFASAKMNMVSLNESLGYNTEKANFRIYEMSDESKINELFNMNKSDHVTKKQLAEYSRYLINEIASTKKQMEDIAKNGKVDPSNLEMLIEKYDELNTTSTKVVEYLDYLAEKLQIVVNENNALKKKTNNLAKHNDYLAENLEKAIAFTEYVAENLDKTIAYSEYLAENLDKNISYSEYLAENLDKNIAYSEYLAENLDKNIAYSEYIAENLDKNIAYSEYLAENLDKNIAYSEYLAENLDNSIAYSEYLAEHVEGNIAFSEYIAENLQDNINYSEYIGENLDKSISYQGLIAETLNGSKLNESSAIKFPTLEDAGFTALLNESDCEDCDHEKEEKEEKEETMEEVPMTEEENEEMNESVSNNINESKGFQESDLSKSIDELIKEAKKREALETNDLHFLQFLNKSQVDSFHNLSQDDRERVILHINESEYVSQKQVLTLISEALSAKNETIDERLLRMMPEDTKLIWEKLDGTSKKSILSQARLWPENSLMNESQVEHFWSTRNFKLNEASTKKLISHDALIQEDKLSDEEANSILERFKRV